MPRFFAARAVGTLTYPPTEMTMRGCRALSNASACLVAFRRTLTVEIFFRNARSEICRLKPCTARSDIAILVGGTKEVSMPDVEPT